METKIEKDTYYIHDLGEIVFFNHYSNVWDDGFECNTYGVEDCSIDFEAAGWDGFNPVVGEDEIEINSELYRKWEQEIEDAKKEIIEIGYKSKSSVVKELRAGDYLFYISKEWRRDEYIFLELEYVGKSIIKARDIYVGSLGISYSKEVDEIDKMEYSFLSEEKLNEGLVFLSNKKAFYQIAEIIRQVSNKIFLEIKAQVKNKSNEGK